MLEPEEDGNRQELGRKEFQADTCSSHLVDVYRPPTPPNIKGLAEVIIVSMMKMGASHPMGETRCKQVNHSIRSDNC